MKKLNKETLNKLRACLYRWHVMYDMAGMMRGVIFSCIVFAGAVAAGIAAFSPAVLLLPCIVAYGIQKKITKLLTWFNDHVHIS